MESRVSVCVCVCVCDVSMHTSPGLCAFSSPDLQWHHFQPRKKASGLFPHIPVHVYLCLVSSVHLCTHVNTCWSDLPPLQPSIHLSASCSVSLFASLVDRQLFPCDSVGLPFAIMSGSLRSPCQTRVMLWVFVFRWNMCKCKHLKS